MVPKTDDTEVRGDRPEDFLNRELAWLSFARRVLAMVENQEIPLLERLRFAGIVGMLHDEFAMKRVSGLKRRLGKGSRKVTPGGLDTQELFSTCREEVLAQATDLDHAIHEELLPALEQAGIPIRDFGGLDKEQQSELRDYFRNSVEPILTPLAVDAEHPFPFISNLGLNLGVVIPATKKKAERFVRIKVPGNRPRWVPLPGGGGYVPLEQVIAANLDEMIPGTEGKAYLFRVTRGASGDPELNGDLSMEEASGRPGSIIRQVSGELKARRFAGTVRLQVEPSMPKKLRLWLAEQLDLEDSKDVYRGERLLGVSDLAQIEAPGLPHLLFTPHHPRTHARLKWLQGMGTGAIFDEIRRGDVLLHHPYHCFNTSVLRFIESGARDPDVLAIKLTIYRTSRDSPIVRALADAARRGKQVAVLVEVTARFDEAPNIAWGEFLEKEGVHVSYGVESLKTHVKLALVVREEGGRVRRYAHIGTGNYHSGTARIYEDLGILTCHPELCEDVADVFNSLTGSMPYREYRHMLVAPSSMRTRFTDLIRREAEHAAAGRPSGIRAKMNQLQDYDVIRELYAASRAGVPIELNIRGLCCLRPGVEGLSENIRLFSVVGRFLEHSRLYRFENGGQPEFFLGSADWMKRNLDRRVETVSPVHDAEAQRELDEIFALYTRDNCTAWDCGPDGAYRRRTPTDGEVELAAQVQLIERVRS